MTSVISRALLAVTFSAAPLALAAQTAPTTAPATAPAAAPAASEGKFMLRVRGFAMITADKSDAVPLLGLAADRISTSDVGFAELDISYFATSHLALSVSGSYPITHDAFINGTTVGTFKQTPLTARLQYHIMPAARFRPYLGAGVIVAPISDVDLVANGIGRLDLDTPAVGPIGQIGADFKLANHWFLNVDARYAMLKTTMSIGVNPVSDLGLNPITFGGGIGYRF